MQYRTAWSACTVLNGLRSWERGFILGALKRAEQDVLQTAVLGLCAASDLGIVDCSNLRASCCSGRWIRRQRAIYIECVVLLQPSGERITKRYKSPKRGGA